MTNIFSSKSKHIFVIAEAGSNWKAGTYKNDLKRAKKLIDASVEAGADAIKFQTFRANTVYVKNAGPSNYLGKSGIKIGIDELFENLEMPYKMLKELSTYCKKKKIQFMSTPFSVEDAKHVNKFVKIHKIASYELNHIRLLEFLAKTKKPIIISTGANNIEEIEFAVNRLKKFNVKNITILQCTACYPAPLETLNLLTIPEIKKKFNVSVGLSDHSLEPSIGPLIAIGLGAKVIEKHFTINKKLKGPDHKFALDPNELKIMIRQIRQAEKSLGERKKYVLKDEKELREFAVRSIQAIKEIKEGGKFQEGENIEVLRSGNKTRGADARFLMKINGKRSKRSIKLGEGIRLKDII
jgi:N,N'-diacetyllegionaminate synthase